MTVSQDTLDPSLVTSTTRLGNDSLQLVNLLLGALESPELYMC